RFMMKLVVGYPSKTDEIAIIDRMSAGSPPVVENAIDINSLIELRKLIELIYVDDKVKSYVVDLVFATREPEAVGLAELKPLLLYGASPRASLALVKAARARAFLDGRGYVTPQDIKAVGYSVLRHRVIPSYEAEAEEMTAEDLLRQIFDHVPVP
ncbi:MAG: MoxR family ATPase, partial [bacterium]|nr:MoxR family ATPase [bacterium]